MELHRHIIALRQSNPISPLRSYHDITLVRACVRCRQLHLRLITQYRCIVVRWKRAGGTTPLDGMRTREGTDKVHTTLARIINHNRRSTDLAWTAGSVKAAN